MTPYQVRDGYRPGRGRHFFDEDTMRFFGDTMDSYGVTSLNGQTFMYRKRDATVNVFGRVQRAGREFFGCWQILFNETPHPVSSLDLKSCDDDTKERVYNHLYERVEA